jgi:hypothetical protein
VLLMFGASVFERVRKRAGLLASGRWILEDTCRGRRAASLAERQASSHVPPHASLRYASLPDDVGGVPAEEIQIR